MNMYDRKGGQTERKSKGEKQCQSWKVPVMAASPAPPLLPTRHSEGNESLSLR